MLSKLQYYNKLFREIRGMQSKGAHTPPPPPAEINPRDASDKLW